ncbi:hypothetical protein L596_029260 [Steinernema carpocapsae]|uniref:Uncharacterized protein n=1 Tax=Steinernema carpocapsae TaxID=34508 RepID=A0A4U5LU47_STECR|nr:hypothetical protein L596_029260 [Steinernema carpocapsae]
MSAPLYNGSVGGFPDPNVDWAALAHQWAARPPPPRLHPPQPPAPPGYAYPPSYPPMHPPNHQFYGGHASMNSNVPRIKPPLIPRPTFPNPLLPHNASGGYFSSSAMCPPPRMMPPNAPRMQMLPPHGPWDSWPNPMPPEEWCPRGPPPRAIFQGMPPRGPSEPPPPPPSVTPPPPNAAPYTKDDQEEWSVSYDPTLEDEGDEYVKSCESANSGSGDSGPLEDSEFGGAMSHWLTGTAEASYQPPTNHEAAHAEWLRNQISSAGDDPPEPDKQVKKIPAWMQEALDKKERDRQKKAEKEERDRILEEQRKQREAEKAALRQGLNSDSEEESENRLEAPANGPRRLTDEEKEEIMVSSLKTLMTDVLLSVTETELYRISSQTLEKLTQLDQKKKAQPQIVRQSEALAALSAFGGDDDSDEEEEDVKKQEDQQPTFKTPDLPTFKKQLSDRVEEPRQASPERLGICLVYIFQSGNLASSPLCQFEGQLKGLVGSFCVLIFILRIPLLLLLANAIVPAIAVAPKMGTPTENAPPLRRLRSTNGATGLDHRTASTGAINAALDRVPDRDLPNGAASTVAVIEGTAARSDDPHVPFWDIFEAC